MFKVFLLFGVCAALALAGCSPVLDWREVRLKAEAMTLLFPCKPKSQSRTLALGGRQVSMTLHACSAGDAAYAVSAADVGEPDRVAPALAQMAEAARRNLGGSASPLAPLRIPGVMPQLQAQRLLMQGHLPDGSAVQEQVVVFSRGTHVYQASMIGAFLDAEVLETFFGSLRPGD